MTREEAIEILKDCELNPCVPKNKEAVNMAIKALEQELCETKGIGYRECADAMLKMWIDNVLTDGEYNRIMDKLNKKWRG